MKRTTTEGPGFTDWRQTNSAAMVADVGFKKQLWALDPELDVVWDQAGRWEIWRFPGQKMKKIKRIDDKAHHVLTVQTNGRSFRELGADILLKLQAGDTSKYSLKQLLDYFDRMDDNIEREKRKNFLRKIEAITWDTFDFARGVMKRQVPRCYNIKKSDEKYLLNIPKQIKATRAIIGG